MVVFTIDISPSIAYNSRTINHSIGGNSLQYVVIERNPMIIVFLNYRRKKASQTS